jgi:hypothetical protein
VSDELFSSRNKRARNLSKPNFADLIWQAVDQLWDDGYFAEALSPHPDELGRVRGPRIPSAGTLFLRRLKTPDVYPRLVSEEHYMRDWAPSSNRHEPDALFDTLEFLHAEIVSEPSVQAVASNGDEARIYNKTEGQRVFRERVNPDLMLFDPPMEMLDNGQVVELAPDELRPLLNAPIPSDVPGPLRDPLREAISQYRARDATDYDKRSALKHLADVLEPLKKLIDTSLMNKDTSDLFQIANRFHLRHNDRLQQRAYDGEIWLDWMFYVYVATARALLATYEREVLAESVFGSEPDDGGGLPI